MRPVKKRLWIVKKRQTVRVRAQRREIPGKKSSLGTLYHLMAQVWRILYSQQQRQQKEPQELGGLKITPTGALQHYKTALKRSLVNILTTVVTQHVTLSAFHFSLPTKNIMEKKKKKKKQQPLQIKLSISEKKYYGALATTARSIPVYLVVN
ncbi:hypothetical protein RUM44_013649 [Polyplax serrata]|uniref:Uncharacterized protein n=1 Tax=Polyplax serrata TaxID=468196 RepID=A0ABR1BGN3_POLSC